MANKYSRSILILLSLITLTACSSAGKYVLPEHRFVGAVIVSKDVNPNVMGRPSPITLYFFQLQGTDTFNSADFFALYNNPQQALAKDYVDMGKVDLAPGSRTEVNFALDDKTKYIGVLAAYQQLPRAIWRAVVPMNSWGKEKVYVRVGKLTLSMSKVDGSDATSSGSGIDLGSLSDQAKSAASSASASGAGGSGGASTSGGGDSSSSGDSSGGGYVQKYKDIKSAISGGAGGGSGS